MRSRSKIPESDWPSIAEQYKAGDSSGVIARQRGVSKSFIRCILVNLKVKRRSTSEAGKIRGESEKKIPRAKWDTIGQSYLSGQSSPEIAERWSVESTTILNILTELGISRRDNRSAHLLQEAKRRASGLPHHIQLFSFEMEREIVEQYTEGWQSVPELAEMHRVNTKTISNILRRHNCKVRAQGFLTDTTKIKITAFYEAGMSSNKIAKIFHVSQRTILSHLHQAGITIRGSRIFTDSEERGITMRYKAGETNVIKLAEACAVHPTTMRKILRRRGITLPKRALASRETAKPNLERHIIYDHNNES